MNLRSEITAGIAEVAALAVSAHADTIVYSGAIASYTVASTETYDIKVAGA